MSDFTACKDCKHLMLGDYSGVVGGPPKEGEPHIWHQMKCKTLPPPETFDPYSGIMIASPYGYGYCRDLNKGNCPNFTRKEEKQTPHLPYLVK